MRKKIEKEEIFKGYEKKEKNMKNKRKRKEEEKGKKRVFAIVKFLLL